MDVGEMLWLGQMDLRTDGFINVCVSGFSPPAWESFPSNPPFVLKPLINCPPKFEAMFMGDKLGAWRPQFILRAHWSKRMWHFRFWPHCIPFLSFGLFRAAFQRRISFTTIFIKIFCKQIGRCVPFTVEQCFRGFAIFVETVFPAPV